MIQNSFSGMEFPKTRLEFKGHDSASQPVSQSASQVPAQTGLSLNRSLFLVETC